MIILIIYYRINMATSVFSDLKQPLKMEEQKDGSLTQILGGWESMKMKNNIFLKNEFIFVLSLLLLFFLSFFSFSFFHFFLCFIPFFTIKHISHLMTISWYFSSFSQIYFFFEIWGIWEPIYRLTKITFFIMLYHFKKKKKWHSTGYIFLISVNSLDYSWVNLLWQELPIAFTIVLNSELSPLTDFPNSLLIFYP